MDCLHQNDTVPPPPAAAAAAAAAAAVPAVASVAFVLAGSPFVAP